MLRQMYTAVVVALIAAVAALGTSLITAYRQKKIAEGQETSSKAIAEGQQAAAEKLERLRDQLEAQRELVYTYDRELKARRVEAYMSLYTRTATSRRYWRTNPKRIELSDFSQAFDEWYFSEAGGLFLSDAAKQAYLSMLEVMATVRGEGSAEDQLSDEETQRIWRAGQALRRILTADIGGAEDPQLAGRLPVMSPAPTVRMKGREDDHPTSS